MSETESGRLDNVAPKFAELPRNPGEMPAPHLTVPAAQALRSSFATGLSTALINLAGTVSTSVHGFADAAAGLPVTEETLFEIGSISKGFTCALLLKAQETGLLDLDQPVAEHLPWFKVQSPFPAITIRHLMTHTAGIIGGMEFSGDAAFEVWSLRDTEVCVPPGTWFQYSNVGYKALGLVLEAVHKRPFHEVLDDLLLRPLGMTSTVPAITHDVRPRLAVGYVARYDDRVPSRDDGLVPATWIETATADGSIASTARDMTAWLSVLLHQGAGPAGETLLSEASIREMFKPAITMDDDPLGSSHGLGMCVAEVSGHRYVTHPGGMVGYNAAIACDLDEGIGTVVLANGRGPWMESALNALDRVRAEHAREVAPEFTIPRAGPVARAQAQPAPPEWAWVIGHYRSHNPWYPNIRVYWRANRLRVWSGEEDPSAPDQPLIPLPDGSFRVGSDERSPERIRFDTPINDAATRATYSGCAYYRAFTP